MGGGRVLASQMSWSQWASQEKRSIKKIGAFFIGVAGYGKYAVFGRDPAKDVALPVSDLSFVGRATAGKLFSMGIHTIGEFAAAAPAWLKGIVGFHNDIDFDAYTLLWQIRHCSTKSNEVVSID